MVSTSLQDDLQKVASQSEFFANFIKTSAGQTLVEGGDLDTPMALSVGLGLSEDLTPAEFDRAIRQIRNQHMARIIFRDQTRRADLVETTRDLSCLADHAIEAALRYHYQRLVDSWGQPLTASGAPQTMTVLALGKLGACELNLSSDIDLVFMYGDSGELPGGKTYQEFFLKLARQLISSLDETGVDGFVFRVDMRLRPYGESGALVLPRSGMEKYFIEQGREWERYAFIKARSAAGDIEAGKQFLDWLQPFVYRKHLDYGAVQSLRDMKQLINQEVKRKALEFDVKLGAGGIREVEFIAQTQQLIWGGNRPELRQTRLLETLDVLAEDEYLPKEDVEQLRTAYIFLRNTEHVIQAERDQQTQRLPESDVSRQRLAQAMGYEAYEGFIVDLDEHRRRVSEIFAGVMNASESEREVILEGGLFWNQIWAEPNADSTLERLADAGFVAPEDCIRAIQAIQHDVDDLQDLTEERVSRLMPVLLRLCGREADPDTTLKRCMDLLDSIIRRSTYIAFLNENLDALQRLIRLFSMSAFVAKQIREFPILLYELTDWEVEQGLESRDALAQRLETELARVDVDDLEARMDVLRTFKHSTSLKAAMLELLDLQTTMRASDQLTYIAEIVLTESLTLAADYLVERHGLPATKEGRAEEVKFGVVAYGKLGGYELGYGSDLDLVFLHGGDTTGHTLGEREIHNNVFYNRLGQRVVHILTSTTRFGTLYELDLRLRPDGNSGPLVVGVAAYEKYLHASAWTWEQQALVRARFVAGDDALGARFKSIRGSVLAADREAQKLRQDVIAMREKMRAHLDANTQPEGASEVLLAGFDLKQSVGAIVDIEFLVQFLVLQHSARWPELTSWTDKVRILDKLASCEIIEAAEASLLQEAYVAYRAAVHFERLGGQLTQNERLQGFRERVVSIWQKYLAED